jgi:hypothetical protein
VVSAELSLSKRSTRSCGPSFLIPEHYSLLWGQVGQCGTSLLFVGRIVPLPGHIPSCVGHISPLTESLTHLGGRVDHCWPVLLIVD